MKNQQNQQVVVVIGAGGIGQAIGRRQGSGRTVLLADRNETVLKNAQDAVEAAGHSVVTHAVDASSRESVHALAHYAAGLGDVVNVVHTAGLSPVQATPDALLAVDLYGVGHHQARAADGDDVAELLQARGRPGSLTGFAVDGTRPAGAGSRLSRT